MIQTIDFHHEDPGHLSKIINSFFSSNKFKILSISSYRGELTFCRHNVRIFYEDGKIGGCVFKSNVSEENNPIVDDLIGENRIE